MRTKSFISLGALATIAALSFAACAQGVEGTTDGDPTGSGIGEGGAEDALGTTASGSSGSSGSNGSSSSSGSASSSSSSSGAGSSGSAGDDGGSSSGADDGGASSSSGSSSSSSSGSSSSSSSSGGTAALCPSGKDSTYEDEWAFVCGESTGGGVSECTSNSTCSSGTCCYIYAGGPICGSVGFCVFQ
jgi:hypothetical protein